MLWRRLLAGLVLVASCNAAESPDAYISVKLYSGLEYKGVLQKDEDGALVVRTSLGEYRLRKTDIISTRKYLTEEETREIKSGLAARERAGSRRAEEVAGGGEAPVRADSLPAAEPEHVIQRETLGHSFGNRLEPYERMDRQLNKRLAFEFIDTPLVEAIQFVGELTGVNFIIDPKVRAAKPVLSLNVRDMDAATVIKWITRLTETYAEVKDQAIYITDKPSQAAEDEERQHIMDLAAALHATVDLPPAGQPLTDADLTKIALQLWEKEEPKIVDFPGPEIGIGMTGSSGSSPNPFGAAPK